MAYTICKYGRGGGPIPDVPDGKTVTPINDVEIWQECAGLTPTYTTLNEVLNDSGYLCALMASDNAVDYMVRSTDWSTVITVPTMTANNAPYGEAFGSSVQSACSYFAAFDKVISLPNANKWCSNAEKPAYLGYKFVSPISVAYFDMTVGDNDVPTEFILQGSNDGTNWTDIQSYINSEVTSLATARFTVTNDNYYQYFRLYVSATDHPNRLYVQIVELQFYSAAIPSSQNAMKAIGASDYASDTLLANSTWKDAIINSEYFTDVLTTTVPNMTSNVSPCGTASASSIYSSVYDAYHAFDGGFVINVNEWCPLSSGGSTTWVQYDFGRAISIKKWATYSRHSTYHTYTIFASNDNSNFVQVSSSYKPTADDIWDYFNCDLDDTTLYRYYRMQMVLSDTSKGNFKELQFYGRSNAGVQTWLHAANITDKSYTSLSQVLNDTSALITLMSTPNAVDYLVTAKAWISTITNNETAMGLIGANDYAANTLLADVDWYNGIIYSTYANSVFNINVPNMTNNTLPEGECISNGAGTGAAWDNWYGFDGNWNYDTVNNSNMFMSNTTSTTTGWLGYKFTSPVEITLCQILLANNTTTAHNEYIMVQGSNDGSSWTNLLTGNMTIAVPSRAAFIPGRLTPVSIPSPTKYQYYRITRNGTGVDRFAVVELQFLAHKLGGVQTLLRTAGITDKNYTNIRQLLNDTDTLTIVINSEDAIDYLVTAKAFINDICNNESAMALIGNSNYASNTLLADEEWCNGICNSTYFDKVLQPLVPVMTSDTTPSGEAFGDSYYSGQPYYKAFDNDMSTTWSSNVNSYSSNTYIGYSFPNPVKVYICEFGQRVDSVSRSVTGCFQKSDDKSIWSNITGSLSLLQTTSTPTRLHYTTISNTAALHFRFLYTGKGGFTDNWNPTTAEIQFYGRQDV